MECYKENLGDFSCKQPHLKERGRHLSSQTTWKVGFDAEFKSSSRWFVVEIVFLPITVIYTYTYNACYRV